MCGQSLSTGYPSVDPLVALMLMTSRPEQNSELGEIQAGLELIRGCCVEGIGGDRDSNKSLESIAKIATDLHRILLSLKDTDVFDLDGMGYGKKHKGV